MTCQEIMTSPHSLAKTGRIAVAHIAQITREIARRDAKAAAAWAVRS